MAITYTWKITEIHTKNSANTIGIIVQTRWEKIGTDENGNTGTFIGSTPFNFNPTTQNSTFTPLEQLSEIEVLTWIQAVVTGEYEKHVNQYILEVIQEMASPKTMVEIPWAV